MVEMMRVWPECGPNDARVCVDVVEVMSVWPEYGRNDARLPYGRNDACVA